MFRQYGVHEGCGACNDKNIVITCVGSVTAALTAPDARQPHNSPESTNSFPAYRNLVLRVWSRSCVSGEQQSSNQMMAAATTEARPSCPFCRFTVTTDGENDMYALMHHLEFSHPENGHSPFMVSDRSQSRHRSRSRSTRRSISSSTEGTAASRSRSLPPSLDNGDEDVYIDCPMDCGDAIHIREIQDHMDLHEIEGQALDDPQQQKSRSPSAHSSREQDVSDTQASSGKRISSRGTETTLTVPRTQRISRKTKEPMTHGGFKSLFLGPAPRKIRSSQKTSKPGTVKRLGVMFLRPAFVISISRTKHGIRKQNWGPMRLRSECLLGCTSNLTAAPEFPPRR